MSSAAILAVYSAGYMRTQTAAEALEAESARRRPGIPAPGPPTIGPMADASAISASGPDTPTAAVQVEAVDPATGSRAGGATAGADGQVPGQQPQPRTGLAAAATAAVPRSSAEQNRTTPATASTETGPRTLAAQAPVPVPAQAAVLDSARTGAVLATNPPATTAATSEAATPTAPGITALPAVTVAAVATPETPPTAAAPRYKNGTFTGWGSSRHGDIEARVVIEDGRITSATIAQCLTRWPCTWIAPLPPQVVQRQSPETDFVSGATQSTNAFYYGVVQALGKASLP